jgi:cytoskeletal protein RodZ
MNPWLHPQGPESSRTYWLRRLVAVVVALVVLAVAVRVLDAIAGRGDTSSTIRANAPVTSATTASVPTTARTPASTGASTTSSTPSASTAPRPQPATSAKPTSAKPTTKPTPSKPTCSVDDLRVALAGARQVKSGATTTYRIRVVNTAEADCAVPLDRQPITLAITSGADNIWTTADCGTWAPHGTLRIKAGAERIFPITWTTQRSGSGCALVKQQLRGGTYWAKATLGTQSAGYRTVLYLG